MPGWMSAGGGGGGQQAGGLATADPHALSKPRAPEPEPSSSYAPSWSQPSWSRFGGGRSDGAQLLIQPPDGGNGGAAKRVEEPGCLSRTCCSFKTALVPVLFLSGMLSLLYFILRFVLHCDRDDLKTYTIAIGVVEILASIGLLATLLRNEGAQGWLCTACFFSVLFALASAALLIAEWISYGDCTGVDGDGVSIPNEVVPAIDTLLLPFWSLCAYLFKRGMEARKLEKEQGRYRGSGGAPHVQSIL